jgi:hypothetical protein
MLSLTRNRLVAICSVAATAVAASGCVEPFPTTLPSGWTPSIQWVDSPQPAATYVDALIPGGGATVVLRNRTFPSSTACANMSPAVLEHVCDTWYQGAGIAVRVPEPCQSAARQAPVRSAVPTVDVAVAGVSTSVRAIADAPPQYGAQTANAVYLTVAGAGTLTTGVTLYAEGAPLFSIQSAATPRLPDQPSYDVSLTCAVGPDTANPGGWVRVTYRGTIPRGGLPGPA